MVAPRSDRPAALRGSRLATLLGPKVAVLLGLTVGICVPYFWLQRIDLFPLQQPPATPLDAAIGFDPTWIGVYLSIALLVPLAPLLATRRDELSRYARGLAFLCVPAFAVFLLLPVAGPRPEAFADAGLYGVVTACDRPSNSLPSLHAGLTVFSLLFGYRVLREGLSRAGRVGYVVLGGLWAAAILYATLATKQHWVADLPAGVALAVAAHALAWRAADRADDRGRAALPAV